MAEGKKLVLRRKEPEAEFLDAQVVRKGLYVRCLVNGKQELLRPDEVRPGMDVLGHERFAGF